MSYDPLDHFAQFEKYLLQPNEENRTGFTSMIRDEQPTETYLELADSYYKNGCLDECEKVLQLAPGNALVNYWLAFLQHKQGKPFAEFLEKANSGSPAFVFPFRTEEEEELLWKPQTTRIIVGSREYFLALLYRDRNRIEESKELFMQCGNEPDFAPFYAARAAMIMGTSDLADLKKAVSLDKAGWRYTKLLGEYYIDHDQYADALATIQPFYHAHSQKIM